MTDKELEREDCRFRRDAIFFVLILIGTGLGGVLIMALTMWVLGEA